MNEFARVGFNYSSWYYAYILKYQILETNKIDNYSKIRLQASVYVGASGIDFSSASCTLYGDSKQLATHFSRGETIVMTKDITINHDYKGDASIYVSGSINSTFLMNGTAGGTINLPHIDRSEPTISISVTNIKENEVTISYTTNSSCDSIQYRLNNSSWKNVSMSPFKISNLDEETSYTIQIRARKTSNEVWGTSNAISFKTLSGTFAMVSINGKKFIAAELYLISNNKVEKISKEQYKNL